MHIHKHLYAASKDESHKQDWEGGMCCSLGNSELVEGERRGCADPNVPLNESRGGEAFSLLS